MVLIGYKKCAPTKDKTQRVIGVFEVPDDALICPQKTNDFARYRVNKCKLIKVQNLNGGLLPEIDKVEGVSFTDFDPSLIFEIDKEIEIENFEDNQNRIDRGILMFFSQKRAQNYLVENIINGNLNTWDDNGILRSTASFLNGIKHGIFTVYHPNGKLKEEALFSFGQIIGIQNFYDKEGNKIADINHSKSVKVYNSRYT